MSATAVTKAFRDPDPRHNVCLRCGASVSWDTGRPREYCGDACRKAGQRLRWRHGMAWYTLQPWYPGWVAERRAWHEKWERERPEREAKQAAERAERERKEDADRKLRESMPPGVRKAFEEAEARARRKRLTDTRLGTLRIELLTIAEQNEELLRDTGHQVRLVDMSRKIERLLHDALYAENEHEARALFAKARQLRAAGEDLDAPLTERQLMRDLFAGFGETP